MRPAEKFTSAFAHHGEGPFWDATCDRLLCLDVFAGDVVAIDSAGRICRYPVPCAVATAIRRRAREGFVIATGCGVVLSDGELNTFEHLATVVNDPAVRTNDGGCDPLGGFVVGTMKYDGAAGGGAVYRVGANREPVVTLLEPVSISNGVQWSADGKRVFYIDSPTRRVDVFDFDTESGVWSQRRTHITIEGTAGFPDGMAIDEEDGLWIALWGAGMVNHYDSVGHLVETIAVPHVTQVSACAFGSKSRDQLYITTSREGLAPGDQADAGAVFVVQTSTRGAALAEFAG